MGRAICEKDVYEDGKGGQEGNSMRPRRMEKVGGLGFIMR